ncbi:ribosomal protein S1 [Burkholderiales bacterium JOSHI_001]|nr:ribosomal protein S1 [Burkholderiales bacterium JOSHI_001]
MSQTQTAPGGGDSFAAMFEESLQRNDMRVGEVISAEVVRIDFNHVVVNAGLKSESYVPVEEFKNDQGELEVQVGDFVSVAIDAIENGYGDTILSRDKAKRLASWLSLETALESGDFVTGTVSGKVKGGLTVLVNGIRAFLPGSLIDTRPVKDLTPYEGKTMEFKVIKLDRKRNNVVLSRRAVVEASMGEERAKLLETLSEGAIVNGVVKNITEYGAFVDLGGIDGLLHITDMAWRRVRHPSEVVTVGQELQAKVLKFDAEKNRVSLGLKQLGDDPWMGVSRRYPSGTRLFGKVTNIADYGAFVEIEPGIEGLVHVSEMDWTNKNVAPAKVVTLGDEVEVMVLEIDEDKRRISLGMKQCKANPWEEFAGNVKRGDKVKGPIKSITDFGVFVGLAQGIDGLVHLSDLSWHETGEAAVRNFKKGQEVEAVVLGIDIERERISLGIKQLDGDPFATYTSVNDRGMLVSGKVKTVDPRGAEIQLADDVTGYLRASEIGRDRVEDARNVLKEGDEVSVMIVNVDRKARSIQLSIKAKDQVDQQEAMQRLAQSNERETAGTTSLGALLRAKLDNNKAE